jgi:hypothetical protein
MERTVRRRKKGREGEGERIRREIQTSLNTTSPHYFTKNKFSIQ